MNYKLAGREQLAAQGISKRQVHKGAAHGLRLWKQSWPFPACVLSLKIAVIGKHFFHKLPGAVFVEQQLQEQTDLFIRDGFRVGKVAFQHGSSVAKPVCPFLSSQRFGLTGQTLFLPKKQNT